MLRPRLIPCLLVHKGGLVKSEGFKGYRYVGDPINAVRIFNEKEADELLVLDIDATAHGAEPDYRLIGRLAAECRMPLCYGGGIVRPEQAKRIVSLGVEKISLSSAAIRDPLFVTRAAEEVGRQSVVVTLDVKRSRGLRGRNYELRSVNGLRPHQVSPFDMVTVLQEAGAGEIVINSIDRDGLMGGYDLDLAEQVKALSNVPLTVLGGAGSLSDVERLWARCGVVGAAAGSMFVFKGSYKAVLISYPEREIKDRLCHLAQSKL